MAQQEPITTVDAEVAIHKTRTGRRAATATMAEEEEAQEEWRVDLAVLPRQRTRPSSRCRHSSVR